MSEQEEETFQNHEENKRKREEISNSNTSTTTPTTSNDFHKKIRLMLSDVTINQAVIVQQQQENARKKIMDVKESVNGSGDIDVHSSEAIFFDPAIDKGMEGYVKQDLICRLTMDVSETGRKLRREHMYGLWKLVCHVYGYDNLSLTVKKAFSYCLEVCDKHPNLMLSFFFMALHLEPSLSSYLAPQEPNGKHPSEWRSQYQHAMDLITKDLTEHRDGCIRPEATAARLALPDAIQPKVPPAKLARFKLTTLSRLVNQYLSGENGCNLSFFTNRCVFEWNVMGVSWRA